MKQVKKPSEVRSTEVLPPSHARGRMFHVELGDRAVFVVKDARGRKKRILGKLTFEKGELIWRRPSHKSMGCNILYRESWDETVAQKKRRISAIAQASIDK